MSEQSCFWLSIGYFVFGQPFVHSTLPDLFDDFEEVGCEFLFFLDSSVVHHFLFGELFEGFNDPVFQ